MCSCCRHLKRIHEQQYASYQKTVETATSAGQSTLNSFITSSESFHYGSGSVRQRSLTNSLVSNLIVKCALPISLVDNPAFRAFLADMDPKFTPPVRQTVTYSILPQMLQSQQLKLAAFIEKCSDISLTVDIWSDRRMHSYIGVTMHSFANGLPISRLLAFQYIPGSHTGERIAEALEAIVIQNNLRDKIRCVVSDNASNMRKAMSLILEVSDTSVLTDGSIDDESLWEEDSESDSVRGFASEWEHLPCFAHSLQLVVRDGLTALGGARSLLAKCCKLANLLHQSSLFRSHYEQAMGNGKIVPSSNDTRWNSTYTQLKAVAELDQVKVNAILHEKSHDNLVLSCKELAQLTEIVGILEPFSEATDLTQGEKMVTISCVVPTVLSLTKHVGCRLASGSTMTAFLKSLLQSLQSRFAKLFDLLGIAVNTSNHSNSLAFTSNLFLLSPALDPTFAYNWLGDHPGTAAEKEALRFKINGLYTVICNYTS